MQFVSTGLAPSLLYIAPPFSAVLFSNVQSSKVGLLEWFRTAPPWVPVLFMNLQLTTLGLVLKFHIPPASAPEEGLPLEIVKPSIIVFISSSLLHRRTRRIDSPSMIVTSGPPLLCNHTALPSKLTTSTPVPIYVPGITRISSPSLEASMASWIVGKSPGTFQTPSLQGFPWQFEPSPRKLPPDAAQSDAVRIEQFSLRQHAPVCGS